MLESVLSDVIKLCLKRRDAGEVGKETPKKEMDNPSFLDVFYDVTYDTFQRFISYDAI